MIEVTVKTLDSQNHPFTVEDDITVKEFKDLIAGKVNISAETQRLIYCGRVLQDDKKLNEYDVNGKVVHLVQRAPPQPHRPSASGNNTSRFHARHQIPSPNQIYLGSMAYSADMMDAQQGVLQLPLSSNLSNSRLNVARKMLRLASAIIGQLENQNADNNTTATNNVDSVLLEDPIDMTPVLAAQVYVPAFSNVYAEQQQQDMAAAAISAALSATNNFRNIVGTPPNQNNNVPSQSENPSTTPASTATPPTSERVDTRPEGVPTLEEVAAEIPTLLDNLTDSNTDSTTSTNDQQAPRSAGETNSTSAAENNASSPSNGNIARTTSLADLIDELNRIQTRLTPFMSRYNELMRNDPTFESDTEMQEAQRVFDRVSAAMHALGHAYHALSDVLCQFNRPTPRALLCRPTLVQHAVLQAGISLPVRVQAQVDVETRNPFQRPENNTTEENNEQQTEATTNAEADQNLPSEAPPGEEPPQSPETANTAPSAPPQPQDTSPPTTTGNTTRPHVTVTQRPGSGRNVDIIVAMSPDSDDPITQGLGPNQDLIQSLVHAVTNSVMRSVNLSGVPVSIGAGSVTIPMGANNEPPFHISSASGTSMHPRFYSTSATSSTTSTTSTTSASASSTAAETTSNATNGLGTAGQNSQARGNTATLPTTSTQTPRATPRPHVHLSPHAFRAFDPFLQCNSHHISGQNRNNNRTGNSARSQAAREPEAEPIAVQTRARSTSLPRELNRLQATRNARTAAASGSSTQLPTTDRKPEKSETSQTSSTLSHTVSSIPSAVNMDIDTFYDTSEHEDGTESTNSKSVKQKVLLPSVGESSTLTLPDVNIGSEPWHENVPSEWVSVVTRDVQVQRQDAAQPPYSDAYLSSVPAKRRKVITCNKPQGSLPQVITESLRQAVLTTGLSQVAPLDLVAGAAGGDSSLQAAYREELRQSVRSRPAHACPPQIAPLKRFPNASVCFQKP